MTTAMPSLTAAARKELDKLSIGELVEIYGEPWSITEYAPTQGYWSPGDGTPLIVAESPATAQAIGRCAAARIRHIAGDHMSGIGTFVTDQLHRAECPWCAYPLDELLRACDHATWASRYVVTDILVWRARDGGRYVRSTGRVGEYENPDWARFFDGTTPASSDRTPSELEHLHQLRVRAIEREQALVGAMA